MVDSRTSELVQEHDTQDMAMQVVASMGGGPELSDVLSCKNMFQSPMLQMIPGALQINSSNRPEIPWCCCEDAFGRPAPG